MDEFRNPVNWESFNELLKKEAANQAEVLFIMGNIGAYDSEAEDEASNQFKMKSTLNDLFDKDITENQEGLPEYKYKDLIFYLINV